MCISILICFIHIEYLLWMLIVWFIIESILNREIKTATQQFINHSTINYRIELVFALEFFLCISSSFWPNTIKSVFMIIMLLFLYRLLQLTATAQWQLNTIKLFISIIALILSSITILSFGFHYLKFSPSDIGDLSYVKHFYAPLGIIANDWATIFICLLPFPFSLLSIDTNKIQLLFIGISALVLYAILITLSRGAILSVLFFLICLFVFTYLWQREKLKKLFIQTSIITAIALLFCIPIKQSFTTTLGIIKNTSQKRSIEGRISKWKESLYLFQQHPIVGVGTGNYALASYNIIGKDKEYFNPRCTNSYLQVLVEKGVLGAVVYGGFLVHIFIISFRKIKTGNWDCLIFTSGLVALCVRELSFSSLLENHSVLTLSMLIMAFSSQTWVNLKKTSK